MKKIDAVPQHIKSTNLYGVEEYIFPFTTEEEVLVEDQTMTLKQRLDEMGKTIDALQTQSFEKTGIVFKDKDGVSTLIQDIIFSEVE